MARKKRTGTSKPVETVRHKNRRKNIPTEELRGFVRDDDVAPKKVLYPRDPDLDPQLVWTGKDEQDAAPLEVPAVPVYIQEKVHPQAIIEDFRATAAKAGPAETQLDLFSDFNGLPDEFDQRVDFYHHDGHWSNRLILGDSLLVMTSLAEKEALKGQVQMIYIDPPYGIKFGSNWQVSTRKRDVRDGKAEDVVRQPEQIKAFRDTWELGIHSYLAYLRDRLVVARDLLTESGSVFVQIGDENVHLVRCLLDEVFGSDNLIAHVTFSKTGGSTREFLAGTCDFLLFYAKNRERLKFRQPFHEKTPESETRGPYALVELPNGLRRRMAGDELKNPRALPQGSRIYRIDNLQSQSMGRQKGEGAACWFPVNVNGKTYRPNHRSRWKTNEKGMAKLHRAGRLETTTGGVYYVRFIDDFAAMPVGDNWTDTVVAGFTSDKKYVVETSNKVVERCMLMTTDPGDLVLDPTCGSGTTAYVAEQWGRRWITIDTGRVALTLARTRLMAGRFPYYYLADDYPQAAGMAGEDEIKAYLQKNAPAAGSEQDVRKGFVYKRVPHITLKAIANNEEIDSIHAKWQPQLDELRQQINEGAGMSYEEWDMPRGVSDLRVADDVTDNAVIAVKKLLKEWWGMRRKRQAEIDASIARRADCEVLYDQPYEDRRRVRVTGPFTVESLSPHRTISVEEKVRMATTDQGEGFSFEVRGPDDFGRMVLDNLRTAGVQTGRKGERIKFETLEPNAGQWLQGRGEYVAKDGTRKRAAVCIGPEHGTVGPELVKEAAKEAVQGVGFDVLVVCGFAFDPHVAEEAKRYGNLVVLPARMNPDLAMGDLLKKTGSGNLFMVFGEPDVEVTTDEDDQLSVTLRGLDVYDPTTGEIRSSSSDDIACWFIDTNYNGESFFVRHAYFTGADRPYDKLKRALRAEIDEAAWSTLYATTSRPFTKPETGRIAVKVINHYGDEVIKVYDMPQG